MMERFTIKITREEREALQRLAEIELRDFREQARFLLRYGLELRGLIEPGIETSSGGELEATRISDQKHTHADSAETGGN